MQVLMLFLCCPAQCLWQTFRLTGKYQGRDTLLSPCMQFSRALASAWCGHLVPWARSARVRNT